MAASLPPGGHGWLPRVLARWGLMLASRACCAGPRGSSRRGSSTSDTIDGHSSCPPLPQARRGDRFAHPPVTPALRRCSPNDRWSQLPSVALAERRIDGTDLSLMKSAHPFGKPCRTLHFAAGAASTGLGSPAIRAAPGGTRLRASSSLPRSSRIDSDSTRSPLDGERARPRLASPTTDDCTIRAINPHPGTSFLSPGETRNAPIACEICLATLTDTSGCKPTPRFSTLIAPRIGRGTP